MKEQLENLQIGEVYENIDAANEQPLNLNAKADFVVLPNNVEHLIKLLKAF